MANRHLNGLRHCCWVSRRAAVVRRSGIRRVGNNGAGSITDSHKHPYSGGHRCYCKRRRRITVVRDLNGRCAAPILWPIFESVQRIDPACPAHTAKGGSRIVAGGAAEYVGGSGGTTTAIG